jgi:hypothetical protein
MLKTAFCDKNCAKEWQSNLMKGLNAELNTSRMTLEVRQKLRDSRLNTGAGKAYPKTFGRHTHRIVAEEMLGRPLLKGEVVHHIDENKRNNDPSNLRVFATQAEHAAWHKNHPKIKN